MNRAHRILLSLSVVCSGVCSGIPTSHAQTAGQPTEAQNPARGPGAAPSKDALRMGSPLNLPPGVSREAMWPAPTAEDWKKPCLVVWQRTFDDALRVSRETHKPILACVNMDGEIASEHFAGIRYRTPDTARLFEPYVCVIASVYRHTPRDYDEQGQRVLCPRFGTVTCGEHIAMETVLFERFLDEKRVAPRHIEIEPSGEKSYDVYFSWDTQTVFTALVEGVKDRPPPVSIVRDDMPIEARTASSDVVDRIAVEEAYRRGTPEVRRKLLEATFRQRDVDEVDLLRQAIFGFDVELARLARSRLAQCESEGAVDLIAEALKVPMEPGEREALIAAAERLAQKYPRARTLVAVQRGLSQSSKLVDVQGWSAAIAGDDGARARSAYELSSSVESRAAATEAHPEDSVARVALAESLVARAEDPAIERRFVPLILEDAQNLALEAQKQGARGWRIDALLAVTRAALKDRDRALASAVAAVEGGMPRPTGEADGIQERSAVTVLALFAEARQRAIAKAYHEKTAWPPQWLSDIHAAYSVLTRHPLGTDEHVAAYFDFLRWLGATPRAREVLDAGLARFPESAALHGRLRTSILWAKGPDALEDAYAALIAGPTASANLEWFAGYASLVAAEAHRKAREADRASASYDRGIAHYEREIEKNAAARDGAQHYIALAHAGKARIALEQGDLERATSEILAAFRARPDSAASLDGLNITPVDTANMLRARASEAKREDLAAQVTAALDALNPTLRELPAYEREIPPERPSAGRPAPRRAGDGH
jgi:hypothetical protein